MFVETLLRRVTGGNEPKPAKRPSSDELSKMVADRCQQLFQAREIVGGVYGNDPTLSQIKNWLEACLNWQKTLNVYFERTGENSLDTTQIETAQSLNSQEGIDAAIKFLARCLQIEPNEEPPTRGRLVITSSIKLLKNHMSILLLTPTLSRSSQSLLPR